MKFIQYHRFSDLIIHRQSMLRQSPKLWTLTGRYQEDTKIKNKKKLIVKVDLFIAFNLSSFSRYSNNYPINLPPPLVLLNIITIILYTIFLALYNYLIYSSKQK